MHVICVDDEELILSLTVSMCNELSGVDEAKGFTSAKETLEYMGENDADLAILDINMPDMNGLVLAAKLKELHPDLAIVFLTGYSEYAVDAFAMHADGYLMKPVSKERLEAEIGYVLSLQPDRGESHIKVRTFGNFDVFVDGEPVYFARAKAKEMLAYLVDRQGGQVSRADIFSALWEGGMYDRPRQKQLDVVVRSLRDTLDKYGVSEILEMKHGVLRVVPEKMNCDFYRFLEGDINAVQEYRGEYMSEYPWASQMEANIDRDINDRR